ncbi:hypothetical protein [Streptomyces anulatus]|uniref:Uncharacterized protein n=1 Tax=Streptomyces anulatus TaxID=1892 RepID=A0A7K3RH61_STRAQ|nr:hypothetical protein [Streptomyces anulatus]NEC01327.1 hypothetical protein [Streptomyces anulatus]NED28577.1 hypothetical protein [Streptomyces anulatus]
MEKKASPHTLAVALLTDLREIHSAREPAVLSRTGRRPVRGRRGQPSLIRRFDAAGPPNP